MKQPTRLIGVAAAVASVAVLIPIGVTPAGAVSSPEIVAEGLNNPYKMSFGPDGSLYVAEGGLGDPTGEGECIAFPEGGDVCLGLTGSVTRIDTVAETQERIIEGLPSLGASDSGGNGAAGPVDVAVVGDSTFVLISQGGPPSARDTLGPDGALVGTLLEVDALDEVSVFADLAAFEEAQNPDADQPDAAEPDTNPFAIEVNPDGGFWAVDAGGNDVLSISDAGVVSLEAVLPFDETEAPPFLGAPPGTMIPFQPVPTSITNGPAGLLVTELTGFPFPVGGSDVYELDEGTGDLAIVESGFTNVVDAAQGPDGSVYVLEFAAEGLLNVPEEAPPTSRLTQIRPDGTRKVLLQDELLLSNGVAVDEDGMVYVSNGSQIAGGGTVIKVDPTVAGDPAAAAACDPVAVPGAGFTDVGANVHREAIDCLAWWGIVNGTTDTTFSPQAFVRRDQAAALVARLLEAADVVLPASPPDAFDDDDGNVHEANINALAALGVIEGKTATTFAPSSLLTQGQVASLLARAYETATGAPLPAGGDTFTDDDGSVHEANIDAAAAAGWVNGTGGGLFNPGGSATRAQVSSMEARMLSTLVEEGVATPM